MESIKEYRAAEQQSSGATGKETQDSKFNDLEKQIIRGYAEDFFDVFSDTANKVLFVRYRLGQDLPVDSGDWQELLLRLQICALRVEKIIKAVQQERK